MSNHAMDAFASSPKRHYRDADAAETRDRVLELFERADSQPRSLRVLLELHGRRDASVPELADALAERPADIARAARRLAIAGWFDDGT
jgi:DNA-binding MarR family transcriptional regulator